jgi:hypothetical protein
VRHCPKRPNQRFGRTAVACAAEPLGTLREELGDDPDRVLRALDQVGVADVGELDKLDVLACVVTWSEKSSQASSRPSGATGKSVRR